jgi:hypothetical protein
MHHFILFILGHAASWLIQLYRSANAATKDRLRCRGLDLAYGAQTASTIRGSRVPLSRYQMRAARALQREGRGIIRDGYFETWVNTMPLAMRQDMAMRARDSHGDDSLYP